MAADAPQEVTDGFFRIQMLVALGLSVLLVLVMQPSNSLLEGNSLNGLNTTGTRLSGRKPVDMVFPTHRRCHRIQWSYRLETRTAATGCSRDLYDCHAVPTFLGDLSVGGWSQPGLVEFTAVRFGISCSFGAPH